MSNEAHEYIRAGVFGFVKFWFSYLHPTLTLILFRIAHSSIITTLKHPSI